MKWVAIVLGSLIILAGGFYAYQNFLAPVAATPTPEPQVATIVSA